MLNHRSPVPLYHQLADLLLSRIRSGEYAAGDRIPSEISLAADHGIGRPTARQAIEVLVRKGFLIRRRGSGTYVCPPPEEIDLFSLDGTTSSFEKKELPIRTRLIEPVRRNRIPPDTDHPAAGSVVYEILRLTMVDNEPVLLEEIQLDADLFSGIDQLNLEGRSLSRIAAEQFYLSPSGGRQNFRIGYPDASRSRLLQITETTPILVVDRQLHFDRAANGVTARFYCRTDRYVFSQTIGNITNG